MAKKSLALLLCLMMIFSMFSSSFSAFAQTGVNLTQNGSTLTGATGSNLSANYEATFGDGLTMADSLIAGKAAEPTYINTSTGISTPTAFNLYNASGGVAQSTVNNAVLTGTSLTTNADFSVVGAGVGNINNYVCFKTGTAANTFIDNESQMWAQLIYDIGFNAKISKVAYMGPTHTNQASFAFSHYKISFANQKEDLFTSNAVYTGEFENTGNTAVLTSDGADLIAKYFAIRIICGVQKNDTRLGNTTSSVPAFIRMKNIAVFGEEYIEHVCDLSSYGYDENQHWRICSDANCQIEQAKADHEFTVNHKTKQNVCACGYATTYEDDKLIQELFDLTIDEYKAAVDVEGSLILNKPANFLYMNETLDAPQTGKLYMDINANGTLNNTGLTSGNLQNSHFWAIGATQWHISVYQDMTNMDTYGRWYQLNYDIGADAKITKIAIAAPFHNNHLKLAPGHYMISIADNEADLFTDAAVLSEEYYNDNDKTNNNIMIFTPKAGVEIEGRYFGIRLFSTHQPEFAADRGSSWGRLENITIEGEVEDITTPVEPDMYGDVDLSKNEDTYDKYFWDDATTYQETALFYNGRTTLKLLYPIDEVISVRSYNLRTEYTEGVDYEIVDGQLKVLEGGKIPVYSGTTDTDVAYEDYAAATYWKSEQPKYQVAVTYKHSTTWGNDALYETAQKYDATIVDKLSETLKEGAKEVLFIGDSITYGWNASGLGDMASVHGYTAAPYWATEIWANQVFNRMKEFYGNDSLVYKNVAVGGTTSSQFQDSYLDGSAPAVAFIGYGMNEVEASASDFTARIESIISKIRAKNADCVIVLVSAFHPNMHKNGAITSFQLANHEAAMKAMADNDENIVLAPVYSYFASMLTVKEAIDYTGNAYNHPNDFGVKMYAQVVGSVITDNICNGEHNYETAVTNPTCEDAGYTTYTCSACGYSYVGNEVEATGHSYDELIDGQYTCSCGATTTTYAVKFYDYNEVLVDTVYVKAGESVSAEKVAQIEGKVAASAPYGYEFAKFNESTANVESDLDIYGEFAQTETEYTITVNGEVAEKTYKFDSALTFTAPEALTWMIDGNVVGYGTTVTVYVAGDMNITTSKEVPAASSIAIIGSATSNGKFIVMAKAYIADGIEEYVTGVEYSKDGKVVCVESKYLNDKDFMTGLIGGVAGIQAKAYIKIGDEMIYSANTVVF